MPRTAHVAKPFRKRIGASLDAIVMHQPGGPTCHLLIAVERGHRQTLDGTIGIRRRNSADILVADVLGILPGVAGAFPETRHKSGVKRVESLRRLRHDLAPGRPCAHRESRGTLPARPDERIERGEQPAPIEFVAKTVSRLRHVGEEDRNGLRRMQIGLYLVDADAAALRRRTRHAHDMRTGLEAAHRLGRFVAAKGDDRLFAAVKKRLRAEVRRVKADEHPAFLPQGEAVLAVVQRGVDKFANEVVERASLRHGIGKARYARAKGDHRHSSQSTCAIGEQVSQLNLANNHMG